MDQGTRRPVASTVGPPDGVVGVVGKVGTVGAGAAPPPSEPPPQAAMPKTVMVANTAAAEPVLFHMIALLETSVLSALSAASDRKRRTVGRMEKARKERALVAGCGEGGPA
jgi:hypothetical protein